MKHRPGETASKTGSYKMVDENGKTINTVDIKKGETFPPCPKSGCHYEE